MRLLWSAASVLFVCSVVCASANTSAQLPAIAGADRSPLVTLSGNTRPEALDPANDRGLVPDRLPLSHMVLVLKRPPARNAAFESLVGQLTDRASPIYHHWLSAREIGDRYGPAPADIAAVTSWLTAHGFSVNTVYPSDLAIDFSGDAGKVREAFRTEIHALDVRGRSHIANMSDPRIPASLAPVVDGIVSLNDFHGRNAAHGGPAWTVDNCGLGKADLVPNCYFVTPPDLATIYDLNPLFNNKNTGIGETIAVVEDSDIYSADDWTMFRSLFGLSGYANGSVSQVHPGNCSDPGTNGDDFEAILDAEYSSAAAPDATIQVASCASTKSTWGLTIAVENLVNEPSPPAIISASYIWCEADAGKANDKAYYDAWQQAAAEGISVFVSSGDEGAAACDYGKAEASHGIAVNGLATTPYNVAVGGTDFGDTYRNETSTYWSNTNSADYGSALSYVPEIPWNSSCGSQLIADYVTGSKVTYGANGFCNVSKGTSFITTYAGSGGPSSCALKGCSGYPKPSWQSVLGNPADNVRDIPDVSLFSAGPVWGHAYVVCFSDPAHDYDAPCKDFPKTWIYGYGTSFASPIMAGIQALVDQSTGAVQGNPDPTLYALGRAEYGTKGDASCHAMKGNKIGKKCVFRDVALGDIDVPCVSASADCYDPSGTVGVLSTSALKYKRAFESTKGWDFATGLGSVDAANLVGAWPK
jgi:subtilase family serine protease